MCYIKGPDWCTPDIYSTIHWRRAASRCKRHPTKLRNRALFGRSFLWPASRADWSAPSPSPAHQHLQVRLFWHRGSVHTPIRISLVGAGLDPATGPAAEARRAPVVLMSLFYRISAFHVESYSALIGARYGLSRTCVNATTGKTSTRVHSE